MSLDGGVPQAPLIGRSLLVRELRAFGVRPGSMLLVHARMSALGWVIGGAQTVVEALLDVLGPDGTLMGLTGWDDRPPYHQDRWDALAAAREEWPAFDPRISRAERGHGRVPEAIRTWPGAERSSHPVGGFAAVGARAAWLVATQTQEAYGLRSPLERLVEAGGDVLMLGAPLETLTILHHAEYLADVRDKRYVEYEMPVLVDGERRWRPFRELDSTRGAFPYESLDTTVDEFELIGNDALANGVGSRGTIGAGDVHLFPARALVEFGARWMEERFRS